MKVVGLVKISNDENGCSFSSGHGSVIPIFCSTLGHKLEPKTKTRFLHIVTFTRIEML